MIANLPDAMAELGRTAQENETLRKQIKDLGAEVVKWQTKATNDKRVSLERLAEVERLKAEVETLLALAETLSNRMCRTLEVAEPTMERLKQAVELCESYKLRGELELGSQAWHVYRCLTRKG